MTSSINRTPESVRSDSSAGRIRETGIFVGIVKGNADPQRMGRLSVYIPEFGGDPADENSWYVVSYASPFAGATNLDKNQESGEAAKKMDGTQISYGWWAVPPDLNNEVLCCFANGDTSRGYWFACLYQQFMNHMVPAIGINVSTEDDINAKNLPPVCEYNRKDKENKEKFWDPKRPIFKPLFDGLAEQGLFTDPERGPATTGARRESPSKVFGFSTPRGNNIHIDDDDQNEFIRLRTRSGVQILIHETTGYIYMISKLGNSWMEISDEGIDMYSKKTISMRAEEGINIHSDGHVSTHGAGAVHTRAGGMEGGGHHTVGADSSSTAVTSGTHTTRANQHDQHAPTQTRQGDKISDAKGTDGTKGYKKVDGTPSGKNATSPNNAKPGSKIAQEGSRSYRNNNPGNLEYGAFARSHGASGTDGRHAIFPDYETGRKAQESLLFDSKNYRDLSIEGAINRWAPTSDGNQPGPYAARLAEAAGVPIDTKMSDLNADQRGAILNQMQKEEGWIAPRGSNPGSKVRVTLQSDRQF